MEKVDKKIREIRINKKYYLTNKNKNVNLKGRGLPLIL